MSAAPPFTDKEHTDCDTCSYCVFHPPTRNPREDCAKTRTAYDHHGECWTPRGSMLVWKEEEEK